jgi:hypothetical protein
MRFEPGAVVIALVDVKTGLSWGIISAEDLNGGDWDLSVLFNRLLCYRRSRLAT